MRSKILFLIITAFLALTACDSNRVYDTYKSVPNQWHKDSIIQFKFQAPDSINKYNLFVNLRNNNNYPFNNLYLIVEMDFPNGKVIKDTLQYKMAKPNGELLGTGFSDIKESKLWYKEDVIFNESGDYHIKIQHAMRKNGKVSGVVDLEGITDVGFRMEHTVLNQ
ncbi:gliding motility lipoprotein GldH [Bizionia argentinensis JUB59]|uniref:Gliding motility lipoprotein GldH n=2 Tax=Bizionia TaxID=283785 RepID=G2EEX6_9FLAO|nr:gliding motility lipoprotein GldH [Bizionia argentinensis]EGV43016.2 gliding motility lipoprotein GldH [Bizionia argentinensis JUB59]